MSKESKSTGSSIITISTVVGIVFIILKLCGVLDWSWWAVTAPIWVVWGLVFGIIAVALIIAVLVTGVQAVVDKWRDNE